MHRSRDETAREGIVRLLDVEKQLRFTDVGLRAEPIGKNVEKGRVQADVRQCAVVLNVIRPDLLVT